MMLHSMWAERLARLHAQGITDQVLVHCIDDAPGGTRSRKSSWIKWDHEWTMDIHKMVLGTIDILVGLIEWKIHGPSLNGTSDGLHTEQMWKHNVWDDWDEYGKLRSTHHGDSNGIYCPGCSSVFIAPKHSAWTLVHSELDQATCGDPSDLAGASCAMMFSIGILKKHIAQGLVNVPIEYLPTIREIISNRYLKVMFKIPKKGHLPTPVAGNSLWFFNPNKCCFFQMSETLLPPAA